MDSLKESIQQRVNKIRYTYYLLFCPEKIEIPKDISESDYREYSKQVYQKSLKIHEKLGAKQFLKFVRKLDKAKYRFIKAVITEERFLRWYDKLSDYSQTKRLKKAKTEEKKRKIIADTNQSKLVIRIQLRKEKSPNYFQGVDPEIGVFATYLEQNKSIHEEALKINGILLLVSIGLAIAGVPLLPIVLGGYQILAGFKNIECINGQIYNIKRMAISGEALGKKTAQTIGKLSENSRDLTEEKKPSLGVRREKIKSEPRPTIETDEQVTTQLDLGIPSEGGTKPLLGDKAELNELLIPKLIESAKTPEQLHALKALLGVSRENLDSVNPNGKNFPSTPKRL